MYYGRPELGSNKSSVMTLVHYGRLKQSKVSHAQWPIRLTSCSHNKGYLSCIIVLGTAMVLSTIGLGPCKLRHTEDSDVLLLDIDLCQKYYFYSGHIQLLFDTEL